MGQLMLINPAKRPSRRAKRKATPAQLRALAKARRARAGLSTNPAPRKRRSLRAIARNPSRRRARRNPIGMSGIMGDLMNAAQGAAGAIAVNGVVNLLPLPPTMAVGWQRQAVNFAAAVALGTFGRKLLGRTAGKMAEGAMTVAAYNVIAGMVPVSMGGTAAGVAGLGYMSPGMIAGSLPGVLPNGSNMSGMGEYVSGMGEYVSGYGY